MARGDKRRWGERAHPSLTPPRAHAQTAVHVWVTCAIAFFAGSTLHLDEEEAGESDRLQALATWPSPPPPPPPSTLPGACVGREELAVSCCCC